MMHRGCGTLQLSMCTATHPRLCNSYQKLKRFACVTSTYRVTQRQKNAVCLHRKPVGWTGGWQDGCLVPLLGFAYQIWVIKSLWLESLHSMWNCTLAGPNVSTLSHYENCFHYCLMLWSHWVKQWLETKLLRWCDVMTSEIAVDKVCVLSQSAAIFTATSVPPDADKTARRRSQSATALKRTSWQSNATCLVLGPLLLCRNITGIQPVVN